jgi:hypothetical protein
MRARGPRRRTATASTPPWPEQKRAARAAWKGSGESASDDIWFEVADDAGATEFLGYTAEEAEAQVVALVQDGRRVDRAEAGSDVLVWLTRRPSTRRAAARSEIRGRSPATVRAGQ